MKIQYQDAQLIIFESAIYRTTTTLIIGQRYILLIDPNWLPIEIEYIQKVVEEKGRGKEQYLLFTHSDYDHVLGYNAFPHFTTIASKAFVEKKDKEQVLRDIRKFDEEYYIERTYPIAYPIIDKVIDDPVAKLSLQGDQYELYQAKGHTNDGLLTWNQSKGILVVGDYLSNIEFPFIYDSLANYIVTLQTLQQLIAAEAIQLLVTGHGDHTQDQLEMQRRVQRDLAYVDELEKSILNNHSFDLPKWLSKYPFPKGLEKCHLENVELVKKELA